MTCQTHCHTSHTKYTITHCAAAGGSTGCICSSSPSLPVECRQTPRFRMAASCCISPSCLCVRSLLPCPSSSPQVVTGAASHPCLSAALTFTHLSEVPWVITPLLLPPSAPPSCCGYLHTFICQPLATPNSAQDWNRQDLHILLFMLDRHCSQRGTFLN